MGQVVAPGRRASAVFKAAFNIAHAAERSETEPRSLGTETGRDEVERRAAGYDSPAIRHDLNLQFFEPASLRASGDTHDRPHVRTQPHYTVDTYVWSLAIGVWSPAEQHSGYFRP